MTRKLLPGSLLRVKTTVIGTGFKGKSVIKEKDYGLFLSKSSWPKENLHFHYKILFADRVDDIFATENEFKNWFEVVYFNTKSC